MITRVFRFFFSFRGRLGRRDYWLYGLLVPTGLTTSLALLLFDNHDHGLGEGFFAVVLPVPVGWGWLAISARRLHDLGMSGWWMVAPVVVALLGFLTIGIVAPMLTVVVVAFLLGAPRGVPSTNRYGAEGRSSGA